MYLHSALGFQVAECPYIVISGKEVYFDSSVRELSQPTQHSDSPLWHNVLILKPEVENIPHKEYRPSIISHSVEPLDKHLFNGTRLGHCLRAEVHI
jgi:hypothetical protein